MHVGVDDVEANDIMVLPNVYYLTYTGDANYNGADSFTFQVHDGNSFSATATMSITVSAVNDAPTSAGDTATVNEDTAYVSWTASSEGGYSDPDSDAMNQIKLITLPSDGTLTDDDEGACNTQGTGACEANDIIVLAKLDDLFYTGDSNYNGADSFTFQVYDGTDWSSTATMSITVSAANDAPANAGDTATVTEDVAYSGWTAATDWGYSDVDSDTMASVLIWTCPASGTLTIGGSACSAESSTSLLYTSPSPRDVAESGVASWG